MIGLGAFDYRLIAALSKKAIQNGDPIHPLLSKTSNPGSGDLRLKQELCHNASSVEYRGVLFIVYQRTPRLQRVTF